MKDVLDITYFLRHSLLISQGKAWMRMYWVLSKNHIFDVISLHGTLNGDHNGFFPWRAMWKMKYLESSLSLCGQQLIVNLSVWITIKSERSSLLIYVAWAKWMQKLLTIFYFLWIRHGIFGLWFSLYLEFLGSILSQWRTSYLVESWWF